MDTTFEDEDVFKQFDCQPLSPSKTESTTTSSNNKLSSIAPRQNVSKTEILDILKIVESSLERAWIVSCGGRKRRLQKLDTLKQLKVKIESCPEDMNLSMVMEFAMAPTSCVPPLFGRNPNKVVEQQLSNTLVFLDEQLNQGGIESDNATIGESFAENDEELEMMTAHSHFSCDEETSTNSLVNSFDSSIFAESYDADTETGGQSVMDALSEDSDDVVVTTYNVENDVGPLGVSITTWSRRKLNSESMRSRMTASLVAEAEGTSGSDDEDDEDDDNEEETVEEVQVAIGDVVVHASRTRSVRFSGIKPTTEDNINRAMELLKSARMMREKMNDSTSE